MSLIFTRKVDPKNNPRFCVTVQWEHGDADHSAYDTNQFKGMLNDEFVEWIANFRAMQTEIQEHRWYRKPWQGFDHWEEILKIEVVRDVIYGDYDYPAAVYLDKVEYVDFDDVRFVVSGF